MSYKTIVWDAFKSVLKKFQLFMIPILFLKSVWILCNEYDIEVCCGMHLGITPMYGSFEKSLQFHGHFLSVDKTAYLCSFEDPIHKTADHGSSTEGFRSSANLAWPTKLP